MENEISELLGDLLSSFNWIFFLLFFRFRSLEILVVIWNFPLSVEFSFSFVCQKTPPVPLCFTFDPRATWVVVASPLKFTVHHEPQNICQKILAQDVESMSWKIRLLYPNLQFSLILQDFKHKIRSRNFLWTLILALKYFIKNL